MRFRTRLILSFGFFTIVISLLFATLLSESLNGLEDHLVESLLHQQADYIENRYRQDPGQVVLPDLEQLKGYFSDDPNRPGWLDDLKAEKYHNDTYNVLVVELEPGRSLYLVFDETHGLLDREETVINLAIGAMVLVVMVVGFGLAWYQASLLSAPVNQLARQVDSIDTGKLEFEAMQRDDEIGMLSQSYSMLMSRINAFVQREQAFTRYASHELKTPLTILRNNLELMQGKEADQEMRSRAIRRMDDATRRMQRLIDIFLLLAREDRLLQDEEALDWNQLLSDLQEQYPKVRIQQEIAANPDTRVSYPAARTILENLLTNVMYHGAFDNGGYDLRLVLDSRGLSLSNPVAPAGEAKESGHGFGLEINRKLCQAVGWDFETESAADRFTAWVSF